MDAMTDEDKLSMFLQKAESTVAKYAADLRQDIATSRKESTEHRKRVDVRLDDISRALVTSANETANLRFEQNQIRERLDHAERRISNIDQLGKTHNERLSGTTLEHEAMLGTLVGEVRQAMKVAEEVRANQSKQIQKLETNTKGRDWIAIVTFVAIVGRVVWEVAHK